MSSGLHDAAKAGDASQMHTALQTGASVNELDAHGESALHWCCYEGLCMYASCNAASLV